MLTTISTLKKLFLEKKTRSPQMKLPEAKPDIVDFLNPSENVKFIWFGHSTLLLNLDGQTILIDPVFSEYAFSLNVLVKRFQPPVLKLEELPHIDTILISHDHYDHLDKKTVKFFQNKTTTFVTARGVGNHLRAWGIHPQRITELGWDEDVLIDGIKFIATPARHFSGRGLFDRNKTLWASWIIQGLNEKIFYTGDSGYGKHFREIGDKHGPFDLAFIENGQYNEMWPDVHMQPEESLQAVLDLNAHTFVPVHWGMFDLSLHHWAEPVQRTYKIATSWHMPILTPRLGEIVDIGIYENTDWWSELLSIPKEKKQIVSGLKLIPEIE